MAIEVAVRESKLFADYRKTRRLPSPMKENQNGNPSRVAGATMQIRERLHTHNPIQLALRQQVFFKSRAKVAFSSCLVSVDSRALCPQPPGRIPYQDGTLFEIDYVCPVPLGRVAETMGDIADAIDHAIAIPVLMPVDMHTRIQGSEISIDGSTARNPAEIENVPRFRGPRAGFGGSPAKKLTAREEMTEGHDRDVFGMAFETAIGFGHVFKNPSIIGTRRPSNPSVVRPGVPPELIAVTSDKQGITTVLRLLIPGIQRHNLDHRVARIYQARLPQNPRFPTSFLQMVKLFQRIAMITGHPEIVIARNKKHLFEQRGQDRKGFADSLQPVTDVTGQQEHGILVVFSTQTGHPFPIAGMVDMKIGHGKKPIGPNLSQCAHGGFCQKSPPAGKSALAHHEFLL